MINKDNLECKICLENDKLENFMSPCECNGSLKYIHKICLEKSIKSSKDSSKCEICNYKYIIFKKFDLYNFIKIFNYFNLFIINSYLSIILCLIYYKNYIILLPLYLSLCSVIITKIIDNLIDTIDIQSIVKENILAHLLYSFIYVFYEIFNKIDNFGKNITLIIYNLYFLFTILYYIKFIYQIKNKFYVDIITNKI